MPELPEVETIRRGLFGVVLNKKIIQVDVFCEKSFVGNSTEVTGQTIIDIRRRGKALLIDLSNKKTMMIHLRMTGQLIYRSDNRIDDFAGGHPTDSFISDLPNKQTRVFFTLDGGKLYFNDQRKFGFVKVLDTCEVENDNFIKSLAKEPWEMSVDELYGKLQKRKKSSIKAVLLDQKIIAGLGNIYVDEALHYARIHPERRAGDVEYKEAEQILKGACEVMDASIDSGGSTMATYVKADGSKGDYLENFAQVFRREGKQCNHCGGTIIKMRVAGRGTHVCEECQK